ncbi:hypothetical protein DPMN_027105 [Dreissena polymorpha]|uniref:Uncharacterized protein n=1 Tax=Dreissena polymorpha TaxID=45954 RepID=A0A9D4RD60_DREPO|nr:hypothetical protein DPMN_027105 [Dreissena polymorpha]
MAALDATRSEHQNGSPTTLSVLNTAVLGRFHNLHKTTPQKSWSASLLQVRPVSSLRPSAHIPLPPMY